MNPRMFKVLQAEQKDLKEIQLAQGKFNEIRTPNNSPSTSPNTSPLFRSEKHYPIENLMSNGSIIVKSNFNMKAGSKK